MPKAKKRRNSDETEAPSKRAANCGPNEHEAAPRNEEDGVVDKREPVYLYKDPDVSAQKTSGLYKPPTFEELQNLKEAEMLFQSNLLKLQVTELLAEIRPKKKPSIDAFLCLLRSVLLSTRPTDPVNLCDAMTSLPRHIQYPLRLNNSPGLKGKFHFVPPQTVKVIGSYLLQSLAKPELNVDVSIEIPQECLQAKDHLNYRYFHKRALYLCHIAAVLKKEKELLTSLKFSYMNSNPLLPIIVLTPILNGKVSKYTVQLYPFIADEMFKVTKLAPDRNNIRDTSAGDGQENPPTPYYNNTLLQDMDSYQRHLHDIFSASQECAAFADAVMLFKVWLRQRGFYKGYGCFNGFLISMLLVYLLHHRKVHKLMTSYHILRITLEHLASNDWTVKGNTLATHDKVPLEKFHAAFEVVFVGSSGYHNLCGDMSSTTYHRVQHEARAALRLLEKESTESFEALFMTKMPFVQCFDAICHIAPVSILAASDDASQQDCAVPAAVRKLCGIAGKGLGGRVANLSIKLQPCKQWLVSKAPPDPNDDPLTLGMLLTDRAFTELELGPPADSTEASTFRSFWGDVSELRRFQDGSINEAVVWESSCDAECRGIIKRIMLHLLSRHFGVSTSDVTFTMAQFDQVLSKPNYKGGGDSPGMYSTGEEMSHRVLQTFEDLNKQLRSLDQLPLSVVSVVGTSPVFRHTEVFPPVPWDGRYRSHLLAALVSEDNSQLQHLCPNPDHSSPPFISPLNVVCQLESSGKWPDEVEAIQQIKAAFYVKMSELLGRECSLISSPTFSHLDVLKDGFVFRIKVVHPWEVALRKSTVKKQKSDGKQAVLEMERDLIMLPMLCSCLLSIHQEFPVFSIGVRLCKRWLYCQLFSNHIRDEVIELIVSDLFRSSSPYEPPSAPAIVLLRFLNKMNCFDWNSITDIARRLLPQEDEEANSELSSHFPAPPTVIQSRIKLLSDKAYTLACSQLSQADQSDVDFKQIFRPPLQDYDVLIHLNKKHNPQAVCALDTSSDVPTSATRWKAFTKLPVVDFDPVRIFVQELEKTFSEFALFFYDSYGGDYIAVAWRPNLLAAHSFKASHANCRSLLSASRSQQVAVDLNSILDDFKVMGSGLVKAVEVLSDSKSP